MIQVFIRITWLALFFIPVLSPGQSQFPLRQWKSKLSVKEDIGFQSIKEVGDEINAVDTTRRCEALHQLLQEAEDGNTRFQIRAAVIWSDLYPNVRGCQDSIPNVEKLEQALRKCYEINDRSLAVTVHRALANEYSILNKPGLSIVHQLAMKEDMELTGLQHYRNYAMVLYALADHLYHSRDYRSAARLNQQALRYHGTDPYNTMDSLSDYWKMNTWNNLGLCFKQLMVYDSAMWAFDHAYNLTTDPFWRGLLKGNRGDVFFQQGKYDSAEALLRIDYKQSLVSGEFTNASVTIQRLARITAARGDPKTALRMMRMADSLEQRSPNYDVRAALFYSYALIYKDLGNADSAFAYMVKYQAYTTAIAKNAEENKVEIAQLRLAKQENLNQIGILQRDKNRIKLIRNFSIALIIVLSAFGYVYINRMRLQTRLKEQEAAAARRKAEAEAMLAREQLDLFTENLREKTKLIEELQSRSSEKEQYREQIEQMQELSTYTILTDADWDRFKNLFTKVYPGFFIELKQHVPDITLAEQRMAALIKLHIPNKDAAGMLGISQNSIYKTRQRLRQRLGIEKDDEMDSFFREQISPDHPDRQGISHSPS